MTAVDNLTRSYNLLQKGLASEILTITLDLTLATVKVLLHNGVYVYIRYNNHNEYSYNVIFSLLKYDRARFDNFDDNWNVRTRPHHFHPRNIREGYESLMSGDPDVDIKKLINLILTNQIRDSNLRF